MLHGIPFTTNEPHTVTRLQTDGLDHPSFDPSSQLSLDEEEAPASSVLVYWVVIVFIDLLKRRLDIGFQNGSRIHV